MGEPKFLVQHTTVTVEADLNTIFARRHCLQRFAYLFIALFDLPVCSNLTSVRLTFQNQTYEEIDCAKGGISHITIVNYPNSSFGNTYLW